MGDRQTVAGAYQKIESHEELCAERYKSIFDGLNELKSDIGGFRSLINKVRGGGITVLVWLGGWVGVQLWDGQIKARDPAAVYAPVP